MTEYYIHCICRELPSWRLLILNACIAFLLNVLIAVTLKKLSALAFVIIGVVKVSDGSGVLKLSPKQSNSIWRFIWKCNSKFNLKFTVKVIEAHDELVAGHGDRLLLFPGLRSASFESI